MPLRSLAVLVAFALVLSPAPRDTVSAAPQDAREDAAPSSAAVFSRLLGDWTGQGELMGGPTKVGLRFGAVLDARFVRLELEHDATGPDGRPMTFLAHGYYRQGRDAKGEGGWFDSRGVVLPLRFATDAGGLTVDWGDAATERGRSRYALGEDGTLTVEDRVRGEDGEYGVFARYVLKRVEPARREAVDAPGSD